MNQVNPHRFKDFDPNDVTSANLLFWLDAENGAEYSAGTPCTDGQTVQYWIDQSVAGNDFEQTTANNKPSWKADGGTPYNNEGVVRFLGSNRWEYLIGPNLSAESEGEIFFLGNVFNDPPLTAQEGGFWYFGTGASGSAWPYTDSKIYDDFGTTVRKSTGDPTSDDLEDPTIYNAISTDGNPTAAEWTSNINGVQHYTTASNVVGFRNPVLLGTAQSLLYRMDGYCRHCVMFDGKLSSDERTKMYDWLDTFRA